MPLPLRDAAAEGGGANAVQLRLADSSTTNLVKLDTLVEASESDVAGYKAEMAGFAALYDKFKQGTHAKLLILALGCRIVIFRWLQQSRHHKI